VPTPAERPFELGHDDSSAREARRAPSQDYAAVQRAPLPPPAAPVAQARQGQPSNFDSRFAPANAMAQAPSRVEPVSAFAGQGPAQSGFVSGRGLY
jgi:hypothetical protein